MNLLENYLVMTISVEKTCKIINGEKMLKVVGLFDCYGKVEKETHYFSEKQWGEIKEKGYYMG